MSDNQKGIIEKENLSKTEKKGSSNKVRVHFVAVGSAPLMKRNKFQIGANEPFRSVMVFLHRMLKKSPDPKKEGNFANTTNISSVSGGSESLFLYCNAAFVPSPDERLGDLSDCFSVRGDLVIHYSFQEAWG